jgi:hypothetical protein
MLSHFNLMLQLGIRGPVGGEERHGGAPQDDVTREL